jgi:hypothetical protein
MIAGGLAHVCVVFVFRARLPLGRLERLVGAGT